MSSTAIRVCNLELTVDWVRWMRGPSYNYFNCRNNCPRWDISERVRVLADGRFYYLIEQPPAIRSCQTYPANAHQIFAKLGVVGGIFFRTSCLT